MRRRLLMMVLLLVAGAIVNVAVAWGICWREDFTWYLSIDYSIAQRPATNDDRALLNALNIRAPDGERLFWEQQTRVGLQRRDVLSLDARFFDQGGLFRGGPPPVVSRIDAGWPMFSLRGWMSQDQRLYDLAGIGELDGDWWRYSHMWSVKSDESIYPPDATRVVTCPIWPGFAINTVFYAGVLWLLFAAPFALRRRMRIKRCLCPKCAYDLRGSASQTCPECGKPVTGASVESLHEALRAQDRSVPGARRDRQRRGGVEHRLAGSGSA